MSNRPNKGKVHHRSTGHPQATNRPVARARWRTIAVLGTVFLAIPAVAVLGPIAMSGRRRSFAADKGGQLGEVRPVSTWQVGMLRPNGLRIIPSGRSDASHVLNPSQFSDKDTRHAYWVATQIPAVLNKLYCWCGCENRGEHRSNLQCFEDQMAVTCPVCQGTAEIAYQMTRAGTLDAGKVQAAVDAKWAPKG